MPLLRTGEMVLAGVGIGLGSQFSRPSTSIMQGTKIVRVRKVSTSTEVTKKNASWFIAGSPARKSPPKAIAMTSPAAEMIHLRNTCANRSAPPNEDLAVAEANGWHGPGLGEAQSHRGVLVVTELAELLRTMHIACLQQDHTRRLAELRRTATREMMKTS